MRTALWAAKRGVDSPEYDVWVSDPAEVRKTRASFVAIDLWQRRWDDPDEYGRFTHEMIPEVTDGIQMSYGQLNWPACYLILGHGDFRQYQYQIRARSDPMCACGTGAETPAHIIQVCPWYVAERDQLSRAIERDVATAQLSTVLQGSDTLPHFTRFAALVFRNRENRLRELAGEGAGA